MGLASYLQRVGYVSGPLSKNTSHSSLEVIKKYLLYLPQFKGNELMLLFGSALHECYLENNWEGSFLKLNAADRNKIKIMVAKLRAHPVTKVLMADATVEQKFKVKMNGTEVAVILDSKQPSLKRGFDLKSTTAKTQNACEQKLVEFGYVRQGRTYIHAAGLKQFYFVFIGKESPYNIFIVDMSAKQFIKDIAYADQELRFLLYFYKHYGKILGYAPFLEQGTKLLMEKQNEKPESITDRGSASASSVRRSKKAKPKVSKRNGTAKGKSVKSTRSHSRKK